MLPDIKNIHAGNNMDATFMTNKKGMSFLIPFSVCTCLQMLHVPSFA